MVGGAGGRWGWGMGKTPGVEREKEREREDGRTISPTTTTGRPGEDERRSAGVGPGAVAVTASCDGAVRRPVATAATLAVTRQNPRTEKIVRGCGCRDGENADSTEAAIEKTRYRPD